MEGEPDDLLKALEVGDFTNTRSQLVAWLRQNQAAFDARLAAQRKRGRLDWQRIADQFEESGLGRHKPHTIRKAWLRVQGPIRPRKRATPPEPPAAVVTPNVPPQTPSTSQGTPDERLGSSRFRFDNKTTERDRNRLIGDDKPE